MNAVSRPTGIPGRRPPKNAPAIQLGPLLSGVAPDHPAADDYLAQLRGGWKMLGNDRAGDCVPVTWAHFRRLVTAILGGREIYPTQDQVWALYRTQNPDFDPNGDPNVNGPGSSADRGMEIQTLLEYLVKHGGPDGVKAVGFAKVDHTKPDEVKAAIAIFGAVWTGVVVRQANMQEFADSRPWDYVPASPVDGGHSILTGGYGPEPAGAVPTLGGDEKFITWADETSFTDAFWQHQVEEAWVVIWPEHLGSKTFLEGVDQAKLAAAYEAITGRPFPGPQPTPTPVPPGPAPGPDPADVALAGAMRTWLASKNL